MKLKQRLLSLLLVICLVAGLLPNAVLAAGTDSGKAIQLGMSGIKDPTAEGNTYYTPNSYVYFGVNSESSNTPIKWRVLDADKANDGITNGMFLLSEYLLASGVEFNEKTTDGNAWQGSKAQGWCKTYAESTSNFSTVEQAAMLGVAKTDSTERLYFLDWGASSLTAQDKMFFLSARELADYVGNYDKAPGLAARFVGGSVGKWWFRSPNANATDGAGGVAFNGGVVYYYVHDNWAARPAFNLNRNSVLFTSAAEGGKADAVVDGDLMAVGTAGTDWKLTLKDTSRSFSATTATTTIEAGQSLPISYSGARTGNNEYVSAMLAQGDTILYYGRIAQNSASGTASITIPHELTAGNYTLKVFSEQYNGDKMTDYASDFVNISLTVTSDATAPTLTAGTAARDSESTATTKFTSSEAGEYYYEVVNSGATAPDIDTTRAGASCDTTEQTISLDSLTAGAKDIYIVVKDAAGNVSEKLQITIPAYIAPSYSISASPETLNFGSETVGYTTAPAAQTVTITNTGNQNVTVTLPTSTNYTITAGTGFTDNKANLSPGGTAAFTVQPNIGLAVGSHNESLSVSGSNGTSASVELSFAVMEAAHIHNYGTDWKTDANKHWHECSCGAKADEADHVYDGGQDTTCNVCAYVRTIAPTAYTLTVDLKGGSGGTTGGEYSEGAVIHINAGTRSDYRFSGWTSSNGGSFVDASSASTTFTMPAADTTVTANWQYNGGGGGSYIPPSTPTYPPTVEKPSGGGGTPSVSPSNPRQGDTVTVTPKPDDGHEVGKITVTDRNGKPVEVTKKPDGTYTFKQPSGKVMIKVTYQPIDRPLNSPFADVSEGDWYYEAVRFVQERGLMNGYSDGRFGPNDTLSRAQLAQILFNKEGRPGVNYLLDFSDVAEDAWYTEAVCWAASQGIVGGYGNGRFGPNDPITREQLAVMLWRYVGSPAATNKELHFNDTDEISPFALEAMCWAVENGVMGGYGDGRLGPQGQATRAQVAQMLKNFIEDQENKNNT